jgi:hypothetical protein
MSVARTAVLVSSSWLWLLGVSGAQSAHAAVVPWSTSSGVGPNQVVYTIDISCPTGGLVCDALDAYSDQQTAELTGNGFVEFDQPAGTLQFLTDGFVDLLDGMGPRLTYTSAVAENLLFEAIPFVGAPETEGGAVFGLTNPVFDAGGPLSPGLYPISAVVSYTAIADIVGPVDAYLPELILTPSDVPLTGTLEVVAIPPNLIFFVVRDLVGSMNVQNPTTLLGEDVVVSVTADMTLNLRGSLPGPPPSGLPALGTTGVGLLVAALAFAGARLGRSRSEDRS